MHSVLEGAGSVLEVVGLSAGALKSICNRGNPTCPSNTLLAPSKTLLTENSVGIFILVSKVNPSKIHEKGDKVCTILNCMFK